VPAELVVPPAGLRLEPLIATGVGAGQARLAVHYVQVRMEAAFLGKIHLTRLRLFLQL
jgi:hypothetical protein